MPHRFRPGHLIAAAGLVGGVLLFCPPGRPGGPGSFDWRQPIEVREARSFPRDAGDSGPRGAAGRDVRIERRPERIVAASVLSAEVLLAIVPRARIAAVHWLAADPRYSMVAADAAGLPMAGAAPEELLAVRPDLVLTDPFTSAATQVLLGAAGVPVVRTAAIERLADIEDAIRLIGWVTGCDREAERLVASLRVRTQTLERRAAEFADWRVMNLNGAFETYGRGSLLDAVIALAGAHNLPAEHGVGAFRTLDVESVLAWRPDALLVGVEPGQEARARTWLLQHPALRLLPCVQRDHVAFLPAALLGSTSQHAVEIAVELQARLAEWEHP